MSSDWLHDGFDESSSEEIERSMEQEVEGLLELDDLDVAPSTPEQIAADLSRVNRPGTPRPMRRPAASDPPRAQGAPGAKRPR